MKVLIIENEIYLAQSVSTKLLEFGYSCDISTSSKDIDESIEYDIVLLSTNILDKKFYPIIERYKESVIILLVSYMSNDTVTKPLKAGANDYIMKPFIMEELIRKIDHYMEFNRLKKENRSLKSYINSYLIDVDVDFTDKIELPLVIKSNSQKIADHITFELSKKSEKIVEFIALDSQNIKTEFKSNSYSIIYFTNYHLLKVNEKKTFLTTLENSSIKNYIISTMESLNEFENIKELEINSKDRVFDRGNILTIDDYVKFIVLNYQFKYPDTELSKKLGISRKSLWEKRKKYGILKKK
jgi:DNA-binding response OmpR family regulator